jgi:ketosteroid isomerase-like protein
MNGITSCIAVVVMLTSTLFAAQTSSEAEKVWALEDAYWKYVQANDLQSYGTLWRSDFLGWPSVSPEPLGKDHITDWITGHTNKGESLKSYDLEKLSIHVTGTIATAAYRLRQTWADKNGVAHTSVIRIIHTWLRDGEGRWQIISGMSAPTNPEGH